MREKSGRSAVQGAWLLVLAALVLPFAARAANEGEIHNYIRSINRLYESLDYEFALDQLQLARKLPRGTDEEVTLSLYEGIILCEMGKQKPGASSFRVALLLRPDAELPVQVAPKVEALFESMRNQVKQEMASRLPQPETENPSVQTGQEREEEPTPPAMAERESPTPAKDTSTPGPQQDSHADKDPIHPSVPQEELSSERLMRRRLRLQDKFLQSDAPSKLVPLRELDKIAQHIRAAHTPDSLREAAQALDDWQQRHLPPLRTAEPASRDVEAGPSPTELKQESHADEDLMPSSVGQEELSSERLMQRLLRLQERFLQSDAPSKRVPLKKLDKLAQHIRAAQTPESLQEAAQALDDWQQRHLHQ
ncbi:hypothetical protein ACN28I_26465 [Archangium gephyra]|uniref:hypothetical protein n=1 Tax=Archangium gephyra TaxID=48 RepID=UPI003B7CDD4E